MRLTTLLILLALSPFARAADAPAKTNADLPLLFHTTFASPDDLKKFTLTDPAAWKLVDDTVGDQRRPVLSLTKQSAYKPPHRSPVNLALINDVKATTFIMEVRCKTTQKPIPNRDVCFAFGYAGPAQFCYAHLSQKTSANHNDLFVVDKKDRAPVSTKRSDGTPWTDGYHTVKVVRTADATAVYFDGNQMLATDSKALPTGQLGVGSFDDTANFAEITIWGK
ncbi:MAG: hypothetical protein ACAI43_13675 [Phycisphaerae bacterium]|nr:hypothetical protein [Tepidisphaeraceae bacterium]